MLFTNVTTNMTDIDLLIYYALDGSEYSSAKLFMTMYPDVTKVKDISINLSEGMHRLFHKKAMEYTQIALASQTLPEQERYQEQAKQCCDHAVKLRTLAFKKRLIEEIKMLTQE